MILYDFVCVHCQHTFEAFAKMKQTDTQCPQCGGVAGRALTAPRIRLDGCSGDFPTAADQWAKSRERDLKRAREFEREHGEERPR